MPPTSAPVGRAVICRAGLSSSRIELKPTPANLSNESYVEHSTANPLIPQRVVSPVGSSPVDSQDFHASNMRLMPMVGQGIWAKEVESEETQLISVGFRVVVGY